MTRSNSLRPLFVLGLTAAAVLLAGTAQARADFGTLPEVEIDRDTDSLTDVIRPRPKDIDVADTVMVFTSLNRTEALVQCVARDRSGKPIGRTRTWVPANGVKFILASDIANGRDFVGHVRCWTDAHFIPSAIFLGPQITDVPARAGSREAHTNLRFPLVATY